MSLHKLTAGSGYDYLTRQVAALDATDKGHTGLATYYSERGESPGVWVGAGLAGIEGLSAGDVVTAEQMFLLFGLGYHPLAMDQIDSFDACSAPVDWQLTGRLGQPFKVYDRDVSAFQVEVARRVTAAGTSVDRATGVSVRFPVSTGERAAIPTQVAREFYVREHGRAPVSEVELGSYITLNSRPRTTAVAGYDLTFSPVKSVSTLWAAADTPTAATIEQAHQDAVADALAFIEKHVLFTRTGRNGVRQVQVTGLVAAAFTHRDSRNGDPDLHTHVAVANKVQTLPEADGTPGRWLSIDGRVLHKAIVAASETYNTRLEHHLTTALGVRFAERPTPSDHLRGAKRSVREIVGVDPALNRLWSTRRAQIVDRQADLAAAFRRDHGRPPTPVEAQHLAQQANLETRQAKHSARSLDEQRTTWRAQATELLGGSHAIEAMVRAALSPAREHPPRVEGVDAEWVDTTARRVISELEERRETWQTWHVRAEAERQLRAADLTVADPAAVVDQLVHHALTVHSVSLAAPTDAELGITEPPQLRRDDGTSVYDVAGLTHHTSQRILDAEQRLLRDAGRVGAPAVPQEFVDLAIEEAPAHGTPLDAGQARLVREMATSTRRVQVAIAPAGTGKTTALRALAHAWTDAGGKVLGLAPSAAAAAVLRDALDPTGRGRGHADTLAKLTHTLDTTPPGHQQPDWVTAIGPQTLVLIDEAGMADTLTLDQVVHHTLAAGATIRLVGDDQQLAAVGAGGILRDLAHTHGALHLDQLHRFTNPAEADATRGLRDGNPWALEFYLDHDRVHVGDQLSILDDLHTAWARDRAAGRDSLMLAPTREQVCDLNQRAQTARLSRPDGRTSASPWVGLQLADELIGHVGDTIITRTNDRRLAVSATDWVKNGDRWTITHLLTDGPRAGGLDVRHTRTGLRAHLPADYVADSVELGYATTIHAAQGVTVDTVHGLTSTGQTRQELYTMLTRGRHANHVYVPAEATTGDPHDLITPGAVAPKTASEILTAVVGNDGAAVSATHQLELANDPARLHERAVERYEDALRFACEDLVGPVSIRMLEAHAEHRVPGIQDQPAWPTLRAHLIHAAADGHNPTQLLDTVASYGQLDTACDPAAVLDWRLSGITHPWNDGIAETDPVTDPLPRRLEQHPTWGPYLHSRQALATPPQAATLKMPALTRHQETATPQTAASWSHRPEDRVPPMPGSRSTGPRR